MAKTVFTYSTSSAYDDLPEERYHFPNIYLKTAERALGDLVLYYEPRRSESGRQGYFAVAKVTAIEPDSKSRKHFYARLAGYLDFDRVVPFREGTGRYYESGLRKDDGSTNKGRFGKSVRTIPDEEFDSILHAGFMRALEEWERKDAVSEGKIAYPDRPMITTIQEKPFREQAFRRHVYEAYGKQCAISGLRLINGGGRPEVQAAHIRSVEANGPDTVRNGLALSGTVHWLFDRGLISVDDQYRVILSPVGVPDEVGRLIRSDRKLLLPSRQEDRPHPAFLAWHRMNVFKTA